MRISREATKEGAPAEKSASHFVKALIAVAIVVVAATCVNLVGQFVLAPAVSENKQTWSDYREQQTIDMLFLGSSMPERAFDPRSVDAALGTHSFNMASPDQYLEESWLGLQKAMEERDLSTVVLGFEYDTVRGEVVPNPGRAFIRFKNEGDPIAFARDALWILSDSRCYTTSSSINWLFPWVENHVHLHPAETKLRRATWRIRSAFRLRASKIFLRISTRRCSHASEQKHVTPIRSMSISLAEARGRQRAWPSRTARSSTSSATLRGFSTSAKTTASATKRRSISTCR